MPVTRDADFPEEAAQLMQAMNRCADGHDMLTVIQASANMLSASLHNYASMKKMTRDEATLFAKTALLSTFRNVEMNLDRAGETMPGDVAVKAH